MLSKNKNANVSNLDNSHIKKGIYAKFLKRPMDFILSAITLILCSPIIIVVSIMVRIKLGSPVIFKQDRPGLNEKIFTMYKFRTMTDKKDKNDYLLPDDQRLTKFGRLLRSTSLDELPELINILKGDMSIVGPRPLLSQYLELYNSHQRIRHLVRPGLTGKAQVNGRNSISWEEKFNLDIEYVNSISFIQDWIIILITFKKIVVKEGISSSTTSTMELFEGTKNKDNL